MIHHHAHAHRRDKVKDADHHMDEHEQADPSNDGGQVSVDVDPLAMRGIDERAIEV